MHLNTAKFNHDIIHQQHQHSLITTRDTNTIESSNNPLDQNVIMIVNRNTDTGHQYTVHRRQQSSRPALIQDLDEACPSYAIMIEFNTSYAVRAWKIVKRELVNQGKIQMHVGGFIELMGNFTIQDLIETTERLHTKWLTQIQQGTAVVSGLVANQINWWYQSIWVVGFGLCMNQFANLWHLLQKIDKPNPSINSMHYSTISSSNTAHGLHIIITSRDQLHRNQATLRSFWHHCYLPSLRWQAGLQVQHYSWTAVSL